MSEFDPTATPYRYIPAFLNDPEALLQTLLRNIAWDDTMKVRRTASVGRPYRYSMMDYPEVPWPELLEPVRHQVAAEVGFLPDGCLLNLYPTGWHRMGWHADRTEDLRPGTGIAVVSLGMARPIQFRRQPPAQPEPVHTILLKPGSLLYSPLEVQTVWEHSLPRVTPKDGGEPRISLTFRAFKEN